MQHIRDFDPRYGEAVELMTGVRRLTAENAGPFTFHGTNSYLIGIKNLVVIDPGPDSPEHIETILRATSGARIEAILVTHTHMDHSPGARLLQEASGAPIIGCGPHQAARELFKDEINPLDASSDKEHHPDTLLEDGTIFETTEVSLETISTPGHTANHLCLALCGESILFSADHVMGWSTSIVAPPDGNMRDYMNSLDKLLARNEQTYLPGHGGVVRDAQTYTSDLRQHRLNREAAILGELAKSARTVQDIVSSLYAEVDPRLHPAAGLSVFAHLEDLQSRGLISAMPSLSLDARFELKTQ